MIAEKIPEIQNLTDEEKLVLAAELWADVDRVDEIENPDPRIIQLLEDRLKQYQEDPDSAITWKDFRKNLK